MNSRRLRIVGAVCAAVVLLALTFVFVLYAPIARWALRSKVLPKVEARLGTEVVLGEVDIGRGYAVLSDVVVGPATDGRAPLVRVGRVEVTFGFWSSLTGSPSIERVVVDDPSIVVERGDPRLQAIVDKLEARGSGPSGAGASSSLRPEVLEVKGGSLRASDSASGSVFEAGPLTAAVGKGQPISLRLAKASFRSKLLPKASADALVVSMETASPRRSARLQVEGGRITPWKGLRMTGIIGSIAPGAEDGSLEVELSGSYGGSTEILWKAIGSVNPTTRSGNLDIEAREFELARLASVLGQTGIIEPENTRLGAELHIVMSPEGASFEGKTEVKALSIFEPKLAEKPIRNISLEGDIQGRVAFDQRKLELTFAEMRLGEVSYQLSGFAQLADPQAPEEAASAKPRLQARLVIPNVPCQTMLESIPVDFVPYMKGFRLSGQFSTDVTVAVDWADLKASRLDGSVGIRGCRVASAPKDMDLRRLKRSFEHWVEVEGGKWVSFEIGPGNPDFVPIDDISPHLINSIMTTEDSSFYRHRGYIPREFRTAMIKDLEAGYFRYGASSITMQMVKNVILYREKTIARKFQELFFTWYVESVLDKNRILEIYFNAIEYGPGLYGIGPATRTYFGKHPRDISPVEAAFFSSILPNPKKRYQQYCDGNLTKYTKRKIQRILQLMVKRNRLDQNEYMLASVTPLEFAIRDDVSPRECKQRAKKFLARKGSSKKNPRKR
ncbi:MAG: transglycosylase domain-containing protein [Deltaproteobacteria bacterium]|nr:transglycosylase domain-containing protein [Deltaproteobacteria bacterium]